MKSNPWLTNDGIDYSKVPLSKSAENAVSLVDYKFRNGCKTIISMYEAGRNDAFFFIWFIRE